MAADGCGIASWHRVPFVVNLRSRTLLCHSTAPLSRRQPAGQPTQVFLLVSRVHLLSAMHSARQVRPRAMVQIAPQPRVRMLSVFVGAPGSVSSECPTLPEAIRQGPSFLQAGVWQARSPHVLLFQCILPRQALAPARMIPVSTPRPRNPCGRSQTRDDTRRRAGSRTKQQRRLEPKSKTMGPTSKPSSGVARPSHMLLWRRRLSAPRRLRPLERRCALGVRGG